MWSPMVIEEEAPKKVEDWARIPVVNAYRRRFDLDTYIHTPSYVPVWRYRVWDRGTDACPYIFSLFLGIKAEKLTVNVSPHSHCARRLRHRRRISMKRELGIEQ
jgi:hypothetical protein